MRENKLTLFIVTLSLSIGQNIQLRALTYSEEEARAEGEKQFRSLGAKAIRCHKAIEVA